MATAKQTEKEASCVAALMREFPPSMVDKEDEAFLSGNTYLRFARARDCNVAKSSEMLKAAIAWRKEAKPYAINIKDLQKQMQQATLTCGGRDKEGNPVMVMVVGMKNECTVEERTRQIVYVLEETQRKGYDRLTWIIDFGAMGTQRDELAKETRKKAMKILQDYYPERMALSLIYRPPWYINWLLGLAKAFMDPRTAAKVHRGGSTIDDLEKFIERSQVPKVCGGTLEDSTATALENLPSMTAEQSTKAPANGDGTAKKVSDVKSDDKGIAAAAN
ncbi:hypothetical protein ABB37_02881 [Leptomonas pyrrhocoris]|uniref:CRAL-TRIO domain-containing protein n=1 Tax=Leptomonas pyrrhocoris TaxID=157538 RepID=A0A0N1J544_LEPPY|nr:hypothetical protein ABB37_02881 [Leptomonas pyrrhocoris]XP_015661633.1 hypothetical protein ABB37_02881 [Leptomonas pyrrhocoris]KPA83193.1 hypothetical protein ABB37_02881 [Leptomonas pyrrhocoris]KPA83194.1 hypothetical protein ABB37_02881 [Leptomonas pyrrhocoris]|eukprot:XP_015661632.1 hypothetical protein ABB37_02881 [Leptomonas pyrrhocoris]